VPAIATPVEGIVEILDHGRAGELVAKDDAAGLTAAVARLLADPAYATALATAARDHCLRNYAIDVVAQQWDAVLTELSEIGVS
jgi:glycosyltransferase involved in cell wall biosynthesis